MKVDHDYMIKIIEENDFILLRLSSNRSDNFTAIHCAYFFFVNYLFLKICLFNISFAR